MPMIQRRSAHALAPVRSFDPDTVPIERFDALARVCEVTAGQAADFGEGAGQIVHVLDGAAKLVAHASHDRAQIVSFHFPGDVVAVPARGAHAYSLVALEPLKALALSESEFLKLARCDPGLMEELLGRLLVSLGRCREKSVALGRKNAAERIAGFLSSMAERIGRREGGGCMIDLPMSRRDIADSLGLTVETVSRQFGELKAAELIETVGRSGVRIADTSALLACSGRLESAS